MSFGNPWRGRGGTSRRRKPTDRNGDEERDDAGEWSLDDPFDFDFRFGFGNIDEMIDRMFRAARETAGEMNTFGPVYYGYSITTGPDGKPHVREFGNVKPAGRGKLEVGSREPFVDTVIDEKENELKVIAEMPGVQKEDIQLEALEDSLRIRAERGDRKYETTVPLNSPVDPHTAKAAYNNGILEVRMKLKASPKPRGINIKVE